MTAQSSATTPAATQTSGAQAAHSAAAATAFAHMLLKVSDVERSKSFYMEMLGFTLRNAKPLADGRPFVPFLQGLALTSGAPAEHQIDHMAFKAKNVADIYRRLKDAGASFVHELHDGLYGLTIYVHDPDGNTVELFEEGVAMPKG